MNKKVNNFYTNEKGIVALLTIVIVATTALIMSFSVAFLGLGELDMSYTNQRGSEAFSVADGCMEEALRRIKINTNYNGGSLNLGDGLCIIEVVATGADRTITVIGTVDKYNKKIETKITLAGNVIAINSWEEKEE